MDETQRRRKLGGVFGCLVKLLISWSLGFVESSAGGILESSAVEVRSGHGGWWDLMI